MAGAFKLGFVLVLLSASGQARAMDAVSATYRPTSNGCLVEFVVHNVFNSSIWYWFVSTSNAASPCSPVGWRVYQTFREVGWRTDDLARYIWPGESLGGFSYVSAKPPGTLSWYLQGSGQTGAVTPVPIPEPSSLLALAAGIVGLGVGLMRMRRRQT